MPLIFPVSLKAEEIKTLDKIKEELANLAKSLGKLQGTSKHIDLTLLIGAAFNIKEVLRLAHVVDCLNHSYELCMAVIKIETAYNKFDKRVPKANINQVVQLMNFVTSIEAILLRAYKEHQSKEEPDPEEFEFS